MREFRTGLTNFTTGNMKYYAPAVTNHPNIIDKGAHSAMCGTNKGVSGMLALLS